MALNYDHLAGATTFFFNYSMRTFEVTMGILC